MGEWTLKISPGRAIGLALGLFAITVLAQTVLAQTAHAEDYPSRPITMVVPYAAGGPTDIVARVVAEGMSRRWAGPSSSTIFRAHPE